MNNRTPISEARFTIFLGIVMIGLGLWISNQFGFSELDNRGSVMRLVGVGIGVVLIGFGVFRIVLSRKSEALESSGSVAKSLPTKSSLDTESIEAEIKKLDDLKSRGVIDEAEYKRLREKLFS